MATLHTVAPPAAQTVRGIEVENRFFVGMSLLLLATVLVGFAKSYFLAGLIRAPLPNKLIRTPPSEPPYSSGLRLAREASTPFP